MLNTDWMAKRQLDANVNNSSLYTVDKEKFEKIRILTIVNVPVSL